MTYPPVSRPHGPRTPREIMRTLAEALTEEYQIPHVYGAAYRYPWTVAGVLSLPAGITVWLVRGRTLVWRDAGNSARTWPARDVLGAAGQLVACLPVRYWPPRWSGPHPAGRNPSENDGIRG
jgi:hypothetical protein